MAGAQPGVQDQELPLSQVLSPTVTPREMLEAWGRADTADRRQNFFCRKLGTPFADPSQVPVSLEVLRRCAEEGQRLGVTWKRRASGTVAGVDQMGGFAVCTVAERLADGRMAIVHVEAIHALDPWSRLDEIMRDYGVRICVLEQLPNIDPARQFARRHEGRVFLITSYGDLEDMVRWNDAVVSRSDRHTLQADQYRVLSWAFARLAERYIVFPDPLGLLQEVREGGVGRPGTDPQGDGVAALHQDRPRAGGGRGAAPDQAEGRQARARPALLVRPAGAVRRLVPRPRHRHGHPARRRTVRARGRARPTARRGHAGRAGGPDRADDLRPGHLRPLRELRAPAAARRPVPGARVPHGPARGRLPTVRGEGKMSRSRGPGRVEGVIARHGILRRRAGRGGVGA